MMRYAVLAALAFGLVSSPALAGPGKGQKDPEAVFKKRDANNDGKLTLDEFKGKGKQDAAKIEKRFAKLDKNGDKAVTLAEFKAAGKKPRKPNKS